MSPHLVTLSDLVADVADEQRTVAEALALLRARGYLADTIALADAVQAQRDSDRLIAGDLDPLVYLDAEPRPGMHAIETAVDRAQTELGDALRALGRRVAS